MAWGWLRSLTACTLLVAGCTSGAGSDSHIAPLSSTAPAATPSGVLTTVLAADGTGRFFVVPVAGDGSLLQRVRFPEEKSGSKPLQARFGRVLLAVPHYPPPHDCGSSSCPAQIPTFSLRIADQHGTLLYDLPQSLGECTATLLPSGDAVVAVVPTEDGQGHELVHVRIYAAHGVVRELAHFIPNGSYCSGGLDATPDGKPCTCPPASEAAKSFASR